MFSFEHLPGILQFVSDKRHGCLQIQYVFMKYLFVYTALYICNIWYIWPTQFRK